jgi:hypothetical protein
MINYFRLILSLTVSFFIISCGVASQMSGHDGWSLQIINIGDKQVRFFVPSDKGLVSITPPEYFALDNLELARTDRLPPKLYMEYWGFGGSFFKQPEGTLSLDIMPGRAPLDFNKDIRDPENLKKAIYLWDVAYYKNALNEELTEAPKAFKVIKLNNANWLIYTSSLDKTYMAVALDNSHYLYVVINLSLSERSKFYAKGKSMVERIISSFVISPLSNNSLHNESDKSLKK